MNPLSLPPQTLLGAGPLGLIRAAEEVGFDLVGLRARPAMPGDPTPDMATDSRLLSQVKSALAQSPVGLLDIEAVRLTPDYRPEQSRPHLDVCRELGAKYLVVGATDPDEMRLQDNAAGLAALAEAHEVTLTVEFAPYMAWNTLQSVLKLIAALGSDRMTLLSDPLHLARSRGTAASLAAVPAHLISYSDFCDAPAAFPGADALMAEARGHRLYPGEGGLDLRSYLAALPEGVPLRIEVPRGDTDGLPDRERAGRAIAATRRWFAAL